MANDNGRLPAGWKIHYLGQKQKSGTYLCQLVNDAAKLSGGDWFVSMIGKDENNAFENALQKVEQYDRDNA